VLCRPRHNTHLIRNYLAKLPAEAQGEMRDAYWAIFDTATFNAAGVQPGPDLVAAVQRRIDAHAEKYRSVFPSAVKCLLTHREQLISYLLIPLAHHRRIRHSNFIERTFGETRRRVTVIGRLPGETSCLNLVWAVLDRASRGWRGLAMTRPPPGRPTPPTTRPANPNPTQDRHQASGTGNRRSRRLTSPTRNPVGSHLHRTWDATILAALPVTSVNVLVSVRGQAPSRCMSARREQRGSCSSATAGSA
jgi:hypothetical protein